MRKLLVSILLTLVVGVGAFAKAYVAFTDMESFEIYRSNINNINACRENLTAEFNERLASFSKKERKCFTHIVVSNYDSGRIYTITVYTEDSKNFGVVVYDDFNSQKVGAYNYATLKKTDPVLVGLSFIKEMIYIVVDVDECIIHSSIKVKGE